MKLLERVLNPREIRRRLGLNQEQFWTQIGVTQSGGDDLGATVVPVQARFCH